MLKISDLIYNHPDIKIEIASSRPIESKIGSDLIMWMQDTDYSHVLIIINDMVFEAAHGFAHVDRLDFFLLDNKIVNRIEIQKEKCDFEYLFSTLGKPYGYKQIIKIATKFILITKLKLQRKFKYKDNGSSSVICSEYVGKFLKLDWVNDLTDPKDIIDYLLTIKK